MKILISLFLLVVTAYALMFYGPSGYVIGSLIASAMFSIADSLEDIALAMRQRNS